MCLDVFPVVDRQCERRFVVTTIICLIIMLQMIFFKNFIEGKVVFSKALYAKTWIEDLIKDSIRSLAENAWAK